MTFFQRLFRRRRTFAAEKFNIDDYFSFEYPSDQIIEEITDIVQEIDLKADSLKNKTFSVSKKDAIKCSNRARLIDIIKSTLRSDHERALNDLIDEGLTFRYFVWTNELHPNHLSVANALSWEGQEGNSIYPVLVFTKFKGDIHAYKMID